MCLLIVWLLYVPSIFSLRIHLMVFLNRYKDWQVISIEHMLIPVWIYMAF